ncbi:TIR domain-containing protein [Gordonia sp. NB41Y]|uniref:TIR domain-containing protein n=1 Tax=Gordonia sp. NB41Y TaxID=875808 RepID=UPI0006B153E3|nr:TIR domain-containing protein [Gordonia sp. NB41Y]KOY49584.1 hypothetical protein ISGA_09305 [Gordonia sp. NB41Y]WLP89124.1 TIR domain-containing protein [Gordonia sp. NB41Y]
MTEDATGAPEYKYDLAVSFAGEQREFVEAVVRGVDLPEGRVFYDADFEAELWGEELTEVFTEIYSKSTRYVVMFISREYNEKEWTRLERRAALSKRLSSPGAYILPVLLDNTELDEVAGLLNSIGYVNGLMVGVPGVVERLNKKLSAAIERDCRTDSKDEASDEITFAEVADDQEGLAKLVRERPHSWQWATFASVLVQRRSTAGKALRDLALGYAPQNEIRITNTDELAEFLLHAVNDVEQVGNRMAQLVSTDAFRAAFGEPNQLSEDADAIVNVANRFMDYYDRFIQLAQRARGASTPSAYMNVMDSCARLSDMPIKGVDDFIDTYVETVRSLKEKLIAAGGDNIDAPVGVSIHMDNQLLEQIIRQRDELIADEMEI